MVAPFPKEGTGLEPDPVQGATSSRGQFVGNCAISPGHPMSAMQRTARSEKKDPQPETHQPLGAQSIVTIHGSPACELACMLHLIRHPQIDTRSILQPFTDVPRAVKNLRLLMSAFQMCRDAAVLCLFASANALTKVSLEVWAVPKCLYFCALLVTRLVKMTPSAIVSLSAGSP